MPNRSELESFVLGVIWQFGPVSAYALRRHMQGSPSRQWRASTGSIYPALRRLERDGLILGRVRSHGQRQRREYEVTGAGLAALRAWIGPPLGEEAVTVTADPLRTRARFLSVLAPEERAAWVEGALAALDEVEAQVSAWGATHDTDDPFMAAMTTHALLETVARRRWLEHLRGLVGPDAVDGGA
ncbi:MAG: PadR family transcriptional regulator [Phycisphaeraceae bacterium]|nr:PadR family transcriptional regulator [Phycisphaeraceae bacterium]